MRIKTQNGNFLIFSQTHGHAVYYAPAEGCEGRYPGKILKVLRSGGREIQWAVKTWGVDPQPLSEKEGVLLEKTAPFRRRIKNIAVKNPKGESLILGQSEFFKTQSGLLISRAYGVTNRRVHQGSNSWNLFNFEGTLPERPSEVKKESWVDFGTYGGVEENIRWLYPSDLIPITKAEWEVLAARQWILDHEFSWFKSTVEREVLPAGSRSHSGGGVQHHPRVVKSRLAAERAGYQVFEPALGLIMKTATGEILSAEGPAYKITSKLGLESLKDDSRFDIYHAYYHAYGAFSDQVWVSKTPFTVKGYSLDGETLRVQSVRSDSWSWWGITTIDMVAVLKGTEFPEKWHLVSEETLHLANKDEWAKIKKNHPYWKEYQEGEDNFIFKNKKSSFTLGDIMK